MNRSKFAVLIVVALLALALIACEGYTQTGASTQSRQDGSGGSVSARINKANGSATQTIEVEGGEGLILDSDVTLSVGSGAYKIELLGENDQVTLTLEAQAGQTVSGRGQMVVDSLGEAQYRVTATEAQEVEYSIEYVFR